MLMSLLVLLAMARSSLPSPLKSATTTEDGARCAGKVAAVLKLLAHEAERGRRTPQKVRTAARRRDTRRIKDSSEKTEVVGVGGNLSFVRCVSGRVNAPHL